MTFVTSVYQAPRLWEEGEPGEERWIVLELRVVADVGLVGWPNAGKSSLIARVSAARPKVANYPFTTLRPVLGVAEVDGRSFVVADIPGLIEGAHEGVGLGHEFLRHVERTRVLVHVLDGAGTEGREPLQDLTVIRRELALHNPQLAAKPYVVAVNKMDLPDARAQWPIIQAALQEQGIDTFAISAATGEGVHDLLRATAQMLAVHKAVPLERSTPVPIYRPRAERAFHVERQEDGKWLVTGADIERLVAMTPWVNEEAVERFQRIFRGTGIEEALRRAGAKDGETICIRDIEFELSAEESRFDQPRRGRRG